MIYFIFLFNLLCYVTHASDTVKNVPYQGNTGLQNEYAQNVEGPGNVKEKHDLRLQKRAQGRKIERTGKIITDNAKALEGLKSVTASATSGGDPATIATGKSVDSLIKALSTGGKALGNILQAIGRYKQTHTYIYDIDEMFLEAIALKEEAVNLLAKKLDLLIKPMTLKRLVQDPHLPLASRLLNLFKPSTFKQTFSSLTDAAHLTEDKAERWVQILSLQKTLQSENKDLEDYKRLLIIKLKQAEIKRLNDLVNKSASITRLGNELNKFSTALQKLLAEEKAGKKLSYANVKLREDYKRRIILIRKQIETIENDHTPAQDARKKILALQEDIKKDVKLTKLGTINQVEILNVLSERMNDLEKRLTSIEENLHLSPKNDHNIPSNSSHIEALSSDVPLNTQTLQKKLKDAKNRWEDLRKEQTELIHEASSLENEKKKLNSPLGKVGGQVDKLRGKAPSNLEQRLQYNQNAIKVKKGEMKAVEKEIATFSSQLEQATKGEDAHQSPSVSSKPSFISSKDSLPKTASLLKKRSNSAPDLRIKKQDKA